MPQYLAVGIEQGYADVADGARALHVWIVGVERQDIVRVVDQLAALDHHLAR